MILWLKVESAQRIREQKELDQCLYSVLASRCLRLNQVSALNLQIRRSTAAIAAMKAGQLIPVVGQAMKVTEESLRNVIRFSALIQDGLTKADQIQALGILKCGIPTQAPTGVSLERMPTAASTALKVKAPLEWKVPDPGFSVLSKNGRTYSFGHCRSENKSSALNGEAYLVVFAKGRSTQRADNPLLKWSQYLH